MEYSSLTGIRSFHSSDHYWATRRILMPYGKWICADGREVLFNRFYEPLWQRTADGNITQADPNEWVPWKQQDWFYDDGTRNKYAIAATALRRWGLPTPRPMKGSRARMGSSQ